MATSVTSVKGIGPAAADALHRYGITSLQELASTTVEQLSQVQGFSTTSALRTIEEARALLAGSKPAAVEDTAGSRGEAAGRAGRVATRGQKKGKGKEKGKGEAKEKGKHKGKTRKSKGGEKAGKAADYAPFMSKKTEIMIKLLSRHIKSRKAKIARHTRKLERLEQELKAVLEKVTR